MDLKIMQIEQKLEKIHRSTRTLLPIFVPVHELIRLKFKWYYNWHIWNGAKIVHYLSLVLFIIGTFLFSYQIMVASPKDIEAAAATCYWVGDTSPANWNDASHWSSSSGGAGGTCDGGVVPGSDDDVIFDGSNTNNCTVDAIISVISVTNTGGYIGTFDAATYDITVANDFQFDGGVLNLGSGTWTISGNWDTTTGTVDYGNSTVIFDGNTKTIEFSSSGGLYNLTISGMITHQTTAGSGLHVKNHLTVDSGKTLTLNARIEMDSATTSTINGTIAGAADRLWVEGGSTLDTGGIINCGVLFNNNGTVTGRVYGGNLKIWYGGGGQATATADGAITVAGVFQIYGGNGGNTFVSNGDVNITGSLEINASGSYDAVFNAATNNNDISVGGHIDFVGGAAGTEVIQAGSGTWTAGGNIDFTAGTFNANSSTLTLNGATNQTVTVAGNSFNNLTVTNVSVSPGVTFVDNLDVDNLFTATTASSILTFTAGITATLADVNINGQGAGTRIIVRSTAASTYNWNLETVSPTNISHLKTSYCNASSGNEVAASDGTNDDAGNNSNWDFGNYKYWIAGGDSTWNVSANWATTSAGTGPAGVPGVLDAVVFDSSSTNNCTVDAIVSVASVTNTGGYIGTFDAATYDIAISGNFQFDGGALNLGSETWTISGNWDTSSVNINNETATLVMDGSSKTLLTESDDAFYSTTISGTIAISNSAALAYNGTLTVSGTLTINSPTKTINLRGAYSSDFSGGTITGTGKLKFWQNGTISNAGTISCAQVDVANEGAITIPTRQWDCTNKFRIIVQKNSTATIVFDAGNHQFNCDLEIFMDDEGVGAMTLDAATHDPNVTITGFLKNVDTGTTTLNMGDGNWTVGGDVDLSNIDTFNANNSEFILDGGGVQTITSASQSLYDLTITNSGSSPDIVFADNLDVDNQFKCIVPDVTMQFVDGTTATIEDLNLDGQDANYVTLEGSGVGGWNLVNNIQTDVSYVSVSYSDASGGNQINASNGTNNNGGNNSAWIFSTTSTTRFTDNSGGDIETYNFGSAIYVTVADSDENTNPASVETVQVAVTSPASASDLETITLSETGNDTGVFRNTTGLPFNILQGGSVQGDGSLKVDKNNNTITAEYTDDDDPTDTSSDTAQAIVVGPATTVIVSPSSTTLAKGSNAQFSALSYDANNTQRENDTFIWSVVSSGGSIVSSGVFTAGEVAGTFSNTIKATTGSALGYASVIVLETETSTSLSSADLTAPIPNISVSNLAEVNTKIQFSGEKSTDNVSVNQYIWNFGDDFSAKGAKVSHTYSSVGRYKVILMLKDAAGNTASKYQYINIYPYKPSITNISTDEKYLIISGKAYPNSVVIITIYSKIYTTETEADNEGRWEAKINIEDADLSSGHHKVIVYSKYVFETTNQLGAVAQSMLESGNNDYDISINYKDDQMQVEIAELNKNKKILHIIISILVVIVVLFFTCYIIKKAKDKKMRLP